MDASSTMISPTDFERLVETSLGDLLAEYGFRLAHESPYRVRYDNVAAFVDVDYDALRSQELTVWIGEATQTDEPPLELPDALRATPCDTEAINRIARSQTGDRSVLQRILRDARELLSACGEPFLSGDSSAFARARGIRSERAREYTTSVIAANPIRAADAAWHDRDFARVRELLEPVRDSLDATQLRRLRFAEKRTDGETHHPD